MILETTFTFIFGLIIGSFLNVCIHRLPINESIIFPSSKCPLCDKKIKFYDNIPIISYLLLQGKCRFCKQKISPKYIIVEIITGIFAAAVFLKYGYTLYSIISFTFIALLLVASFIDMKHKIIPDSISLGGIFFFIILSFFVKELNILTSLIGAVTGIFLLYSIAFAYKFFTKIDGMGGGDIKLLGMIGAFLGAKGVLITLLVGSLTGTILGFVVIIIQRKNLKYAMPFGPFLSVGAIIYLFYGEQILKFYYL